MKKQGNASSTKSKRRSLMRTMSALPLSAVLLIAGCGSGNNADQAGAVSPSPSPSAEAPASKLVIKTSFYPMYEFTRQVAGDLAEVENLVPAGVEPHDWEPSARDMAAIAEADVFVYNGAGMEGWAEQVLASVSGTGLTAIEASAGLDIMEGEGHSHDHGHGHDHEGEEAHSHDHDHEGEEAHSHDHDHEGEEAHSHDHDHEGEEAHSHDHDHEGEEAHSHDHDHEGEGAHSHDHDHEGEEAHSHDHDHEGEGAHSHDHDHEGEEAHSHDHDHGGLDPHVWLSPALAVKQVRNIEAGLAAAAPEHAEAFKANADAYVAKLEELDKAFRDGLQDAKRKDFVTQHSAFGYLAKEYGLNQVPIAGLSPEQEPSAAQMAEIIEFAKTNEVKTIFFETLVSSKVADTIAAELGAETAVLNPIEGLTEDDIAQGRDYIAIMTLNLEALKKALNE